MLYRWKPPVSFEWLMSLFSFFQPPEGIQHAREGMSSNPDAPSDSRITANLSLIAAAAKMINIYRGTVRPDNFGLSRPCRHHWAVSA